ncbi:MAG: CAP domain-containing protein [Bryobacteraceae bacterium]
MCIACAGLLAAQWRHFDDGSSGTPSSMADEMIRTHNGFRSQVGVPPLRWSRDLAGYAQDWANRLAREDRLYHHPHPVYGENLFLIDGGRVRPANVVASWAAERGNYDYRTNSCRGRCGHYTQIVWRDTQQVGCARAESGNTQVWVCEYSPPGNIVGDRPY